MNIEFPLGFNKNLISCGICGHVWDFTSDFKHVCPGPNTFTTEDRERLKNVENMLERILKEKSDKL